MASYNLSQFSIIYKIQWCVCTDAPSAVNCCFAKQMGLSAGILHCWLLLHKLAKVTIDQHCLLFQASLNYMSGFLHTVR